MDRNFGDYVCVLKLPLPPMVLKMQFVEILFFHRPPALVFATRILTILIIS